jgi:sugar phosphate permease
MTEDTRNPQINVSKIPGGAGIAGALFAIGSMLIFLIGIPRLRIFFAAAIILGCAVALILRLVRSDTPGKPCILPATEQTAGSARPSDQHEHEGSGSVQTSGAIAYGF